MGNTYKLKIYYRDGKTNENIVADYKIKDGCLIYYKRFGIDSGTHFIPLDLIKNFAVDR